MSCCGGASFHGADEDEQKEALKRSTTASHLDQYLKGKKKGDKPGKKPRESELPLEEKRYVYTIVYKNCIIMARLGACRRKFEFFNFKNKFYYVDRRTECSINYRHCGFMISLPILPRWIYIPISNL